MFIYLRLFVLVIGFIFTSSSAALTIKQYSQQYALLPCTGLELRINSFEKRLPMLLSNASKKEKAELKREDEALNKLYKQKRCHKRNAQ
ncbi:hypothetical protein VXS03_09320 [Photobacterium sp. S4TG1]|uniref:hypothetical protein n=1 Tax=Photobacterium sp. S4TG1 TaxID=3114587 RepID=UPI002E18B053|nr:hypothetical protein [Photobacterium sp. S4TG1]